MKATQFIFMLFVVLAFLFIQCENDAEPGSESSAPALGVSPTSLQLSGSPMHDVLMVFNTGDGDVQWSISAAPEWMTITPNSGTVSTDTMIVSLETDFDALEYGDYTDVVDITSNAGRAEITVALTYSEPVLKVGTTILNLDRHYSYGDLLIENDGGGRLEWEITQHPEWLEFEVLSDIVYGWPQAVPFRVNLRNLDYGDYKELVKIESSAGSVDITTYMSYHREEEVYPGVGAANIELGYAYDRVRKILGNPDRNWYIRPEKAVFYHYFTYMDLGLEFFVQNDSPILFGSGQVGYIKVFAPYDGLTLEKQIGIGSTLAELQAAYGDPTSITDNQYYYDIGITFEMTDGLVSAMIIQRANML